MTTKLLDLTALGTGNTSSADVVPIVDVSDTTMDATGTTKKVTMAVFREEMVKSGWFDLMPYITYFTGASAPPHTTVIGARKEFAFAGTGGTTNELWNKYHVPHDIALGITSYNFHLHLEHNSAAPSGNAKFYVSFYFATPDGSFTSIDTQSVVWTPTAGNQFKNTLVKIEGLTNNVSLLIPDAIVTARVYRDPADAADTFADNVFYHTADFHLQGDQKLTTSKDLGSGWVKA